MASSRPTKADLVAQQLRHEIVSGQIPRGKPLRQRELATRFGISPTPVREALMQLAAEGILLHTPNQHLTVADVTTHSLDELDEIYLMRESLESLATALAHRHVSRADLEDLGRVHEAFRKAMAAGALADAQVVNYTFHMRIYEHARAPRLARTIHTLWTLFPWDTLWLTGVTDGKLSSVRGHAEILRLLKDGTAQRAGEAMAEHILVGHEALRAEIVRRAPGAWSGAGTRGVAPTHSRGTKPDPLRQGPDDSASASFALRLPPSRSRTTRTRKGRKDSRQ